MIPGLKHAQDTYTDTLLSYVNQTSRWLDLGCGHQILQEWMPQCVQAQTIIVERSKIIVGIDYDYFSLQEQKAIKNRILGDIQRLPFKNNSFNLITANMVVEHIENPAAVLTEVHRVLEPNGFFIFHTPNLLSYTTVFSLMIPKVLKQKLIKFLEKRNEKDIFSTYYRMNSPKIIRSLAQKNGFNVHELNLVESSAAIIMLGPLAIIELLWISALRLSLFKNLRPNIIAVLQKIGSFRYK